MLGDVTTQVPHVRVAQMTLMSDELAKPDRLAVAVLAGAHKH